MTPKELNAARMREWRAAQPAYRTRELARVAALRTRFLAAGGCAQCGQPTPFTRCTYHRARQQAQKARRIARRRAQGRPA
jgi:hypothetical protein